MVIALLITDPQQRTSPLLLIIKTVPLSLDQNSETIYQSANLRPYVLATNGQPVKVSP